VSRALALWGAGACLGAWALGRVPLPWPVVAMLAAGLGVGAVVTPDLDMQQRTEEERRMGRIPVVGWLWRALWWPYAAAIPHRAWLSHGIVIGTLGRAAYLALWAQIALALAGRPAWLAERWWLWVWLLPGWMLQDLAHAVLDGGG